MKKRFSWHQSNIILFFLAASCQGQDPKLSGCQQFITIKQATDNRTLELSENLQARNQENIIAAADNFENAAAEIANMPSEDPNLVELKADWSQFYRDRSQATRDYIKAFDRGDISATKQTIDKIKQLDRTEIKLVELINSYCHEKTAN